MRELQSSQEYNLFEFLHYPEEIHTQIDVHTPITVAVQLADRFGTAVMPLSPGHYTSSDLHK